MRPLFALEIDSSIYAPANVSSIGSLMNVFIPLVMTTASIIFLFMLLFGGFKILTAGGSAENFKKAQQLITWAVVGFGLIVLSFLIVKVIGYITNVPILL